MATDLVPTTRSGTRLPRAQIERATTRTAITYNENYNAVDTSDMDWDKVRLIVAVAARLSVREHDRSLLPRLY